MKRIIPVSVPYGDLFYFYDGYDLKLLERLICFRPLWGSFLFLCNIKNISESIVLKFPSPMGIFFISILRKERWKNFKYSFRPLWGSFLFLSCPMETLPGMEKTCTLRCKKFSPVKSGDSKLVNCSVP